MVFLTKGNREFCCIGLVGVLWKVVSGVINQRIKFAIVYHNVLHSFWSGRGTGTTPLKAKLLQQLTSMREQFLYEVFHDLSKVCNVLDYKR